MSSVSISRFAKHVAALVLAGLAFSCGTPRPPERSFFPVENLRGVLFSAPQVLADAKRSDLGEAPNAVVLAIDEQSSFRAVAGAMERVRERGLAVGYWIELTKAPRLSNGGADFNAQLARVRDLLRNRPAADAIFLACIEGPAAACGCGNPACCEPTAAVLQQESNAGARFVAAVRAYARGAIVVPVWIDGCAPNSTECAARHCADAKCGQLETLAWNALRAEAAQVGLLLRGPRAAQPADSDMALWIAARIQLWTRPLPPALPSTQPGGASLIAVLCAPDFKPADLSRAVAGASMLRRTGLIVAYTPVGATIRAEKQNP